VTEWYRLIENNRFFPRYFNLVGLAGSNAIAVVFPPEHIELIQQEIHNMNTYMGTLEYIETRRKTFENELSPEVIGILNPFIGEDENFIQITETLTEAREEASKRTGIPAYLLAMHQKRYFPSLHERPENAPMDEEYLFPYLCILLECPESLRFEDGVQDERLRLCLFALEKAIQHSKDRDLQRLEFGVANFLNYSICFKLIRDQNIPYVMKLIARHNSELFRYLVKIILDEVICDDLGYPHGFTLAKAIIKGEHIYCKIRKEEKALTDLYQTDASFIYLPGANREGFGLLAETFLNLAQRHNIPNAIIYSLFIT